MKSRMPLPVLVFCFFLCSVSGAVQASRPSPDFTGSGVVDFADFLLFAAGFGSRPGDVNWNPALDLDQDGEVGFSDFLIFAQAFGKTVEELRETLTANLPDGATMEFVKIEPETFTMGSPSNEVGRQSHEGPQHEVRISRGFYLGKYVVTQGQWEAVMGTRPWQEQSNANHPAVYVSWNDAQAFVQKMNQAAGRTLYRLPTEAEWEYACRAGTSTRWSFGDDESKLRDYAWYNVNAWNAGLQYAQPVGRKFPNPWGLYDMHGNVWEWVQDWYGSYTSSAKVDPQGPLSGSSRVIRGGDFGVDARGTRSAYRFGISPSNRAGDIGFRLLRIE